MGFVGTHVRRHRRSLAVSYGAVVVENAFELLYPFAIGLAVNDLLDDEWGGVVVFVAISVAHTVLSFGRQLYDTRAFNRLYEHMAADLVEQQRQAGVPTSTIVARTGLAGDYVEFLEREVAVAVAAAFAVVGSLVMLLLYDPVLGAVAAALAVPVALLNGRLVRRSRRLYRGLNDQAEREVAVIDVGAPDEVRTHFGLLARHWNRLSDAEAASWGLVEVVAIALSVYALVRTTDVSADVGTIFATIAYVWSYIGGFDDVPTVVQRMSNLGDARERLDGLVATDGEAT